MSWFRRQKAETFRFALNASEIDIDALYVEAFFTIALSKFNSFRPTGHLGTRVSAYGVLEDRTGGGHPLLPVELVLNFKPDKANILVPYAEQFGIGIVERSIKIAGRMCYGMILVVNDPDLTIYRGLLSAFQNAAISQTRFVQVSFRRSELLGHQSAVRDANREARREEALKKVRLAEEGTDQLPDVSFDRMSFDDAIYLQGPNWSHVWSDPFDPVLKSYWNEEAGEWRSRKRPRLV